MPRRIPAFFGSTMLLLGAFAIGWVLHGVLVEGTIGITSPAAVLGTLLGAGLLAAGRRLERRFDPSEYVPADADDEEDELDDEMLPIDDEMLEGRDADESYRRE